MPKPLPHREPNPDAALKQEIDKLADLPAERLAVLQTLALMRLADACERIADAADDFLAGEEDEDVEQPG